MNPSPFPYQGPPELQRPVVDALTRVVDPEVALSIVDVGLVYGVTVTDRHAQVRMTMTSPACPVADLIVEEVEDELDRVLPAGCTIDVELSWEPPWTPERMSERAPLHARMRPRNTVPSFAALAATPALAAVAPAVGGLLYGAALTVLACWLAVFDITRRTVRAQGLSRYMAVCLLAGYAWLALAGIAWAGMGIGWPTRDAALHALGLGFVFSMVMGHAPVILPAVARVKLRFGVWFYAPLALLHASLALRLAGGLVDPAWRSTGAVLNAAALALFAATIVLSAWAWRARRAPVRRA